MLEFPKIIIKISYTVIQKILGREFKLNFEYDKFNLLIQISYQNVHWEMKFMIDWEKLSKKSNPRLSPLPNFERIFLTF